MSRKQLADYEWAADQLSKLKTKTTDGKIGFLGYNRDGISFDDVIAILETHHEFDPTIPDTECQAIIREAAFEAARANNLTEKALKANIFKESNKFTNNPVAQFVLATTLSIEHPTTLKRLVFNHSNFVFSPSLPSSFSRHHIENSVERMKTDHLPPGYMTVRVTVQARTPSEAFQKAIESLDFLRGIWNFLLKRNLLNYWHFGQPKPVNSIRLGPVHTLHQKSGKPAIESYWQELMYPSEIKLEKIKSWESVSKGEKAIRRAIKKSNYYNSLKNIFVRYARSLDSIDHESSFLKLWSLLEFLSGIKPTENYEEVIKRTLFMSFNDSYDKRILEHLRKRRNATVHQGVSTIRSETHVYQLKRFVDRLIHFHLIQSSRYRSIEEVGQLLSRPRDTESLKKSISELEDQLRLSKAAFKLIDEATKVFDAAKQQNK